MKAIAALLVLIVSILALSGCSVEKIEEDAGETHPMSPVSIEITGDNVCVDIIAAQSMVVGDICVEILEESNELCVTYTTSDEWELTETHLWVGESIATMPQTRKGNPRIGHFPHHSGDITGNTTWCCYISLTEFGLQGDETICEKDLYIAAHSELRLENADGSYTYETGWGAGVPIVERGSWATYYGIHLSCDGWPPLNSESKSSFARGCEDYAICFLEIDLDDPDDDGPQRWGWTNGPLQNGTYHFDLYVEANECDLAAGLLVGNLAVEYAGGTATVTYNLYQDLTLSEVQLYVGNEILPRYLGEFSTGPGHYPVINTGLGDVSTHTCAVSGLSGDIYVVAHAVINGFTDDYSDEEAQSICDGMRFACFEAGTFIMGQDSIGESYPAIEHEVTLTHDFCLSINEITNQECIIMLQWAYENGLITANTITVSAHGQQLFELISPNSEIGFADGLFYIHEATSGDAQSAYPDGYNPQDHPVKEISWYGAVCFCDWLSLKEGLPPFYNGEWTTTSSHNPYEAQGYRLPTEAEWEYAARYNDGRTFPWGDWEPVPCVEAFLYVQIMDSGSRFVSSR